MEKIEYQLINSQLINQTVQKARESQRRRMNYNFHELHETYQRFLNVLCKGTYVRPHRHIQPPKAETFLILEGEIVFLIFDDLGKIQSCIQLSCINNNKGIDIKPGVWHSIICLSEYAVCFEGKHGPYNPLTDKEFAPWAPEENTLSATHYLKYLETFISQVIKQ